MSVDDREFPIVEDGSSGRREGWFAVGGMFAAVLTSSSCIAPLLLLAAVVGWRRGESCRPNCTRHWLGSRRCGDS